MKRRGAIVGVVLVSIGALLLFARQWTAPTEVIVAKPQAVAREVVEPPVVRAEPPPAEATAPAIATTPSTPTGNFRGRVLDAATRQPVQKFQVELKGIPQGPMRGNEPAFTQTFESTDGRFAWQRAPAGKWNVTVAAERYQRFHVDGVSVAVDKATREIVMPLRRGHTLRGRVFDQATGAGIGDAWVSFGDSNVPKGIEDMMRQRSEKTNDDGTFVLDGVPSGDTVVSAGAQNHARREIAVTVSDDTPPLEIGLTTGGRIAGMVVGPDGTPATGWVMLVDAGVNWGAKLEDTGSFSFVNRRAGRYRLNANTAVGSATMDFELAENEIKEGILLKVGAGRSVRGVIRGLRPEQLEQTMINLFSQARSGGLTAQPDAQGAYVVRGVPPGRATVDVDVVGARHAQKSIDVPADQDVVLDFAFPAGGRLSGRVTQDAKPAAERSVWVGSPGGRSEITYRGRTAQDGSYEIEGVPPGEYRVSVERDASRIVAIASDAVVNFDIPLVQIGGRIVEDGGSVPIVGAGVHVIGVESQTALVRNYKEADDFGQFRLTGVEPGEILLTVYKPGYEMFREKIAYSSPITNKAITLRKNPGVEVRVQSATNSGPIVPIFVTEQLPGTEYGISVWIGVDRDGIGHLPSAFAGSTLKFQRSGSRPIVVQEWDGQSLDLKFVSR